MLWDRLLSAFTATEAVTVMNWDNSVHYRHEMCTMPGSTSVVPSMPSYEQCRPKVCLDPAY